MTRGPRTRIAAPPRLRGGLLVVVAAIAMLAAGCGAGPARFAGVADRIRAANSPIVREVLFFAPPVGKINEGGGETITIYLIDAATAAQALDLWCGVVIPAGAAQLPAGNVAIYKGGELIQGNDVSGVRTGVTRVLDDPTCPEGTTPTPS